MTTDEQYRGVRLNPGQRPARRALVCSELDSVFGLRDLNELAAIAGDISRSPESRRLAAAVAETMLESYAEGRQKRPAGLSIARIRSLVAGLTPNWMDVDFHCSLMDPRTGQTQPVRREIPLPE